MEKPLDNVLTTAELERRGLVTIEEQSMCQIRQRRAELTALEMTALQWLQASEPTVTRRKADIDDELNLERDW